VSKHNLWVECEEHKKLASFLKDKLLKHQELKGQPRAFVKLNDEIRTLKTTLSNFDNGLDNLNMLLGYCRRCTDKSENEYKGKVYVHDEDTIVCYFCGKIGHMMSRCKDRPKKGSPNPFMTNIKEPKKIWVPKKIIFPITNILDRSKQSPIMVPGQWLLATHDRRKAYVPMPDSLLWWNNHFWRE